MKINLNPDVSNAISNILSFRSVNALLSYYLTLKINDHVYFENVNEIKQMAKELRKEASKPIANDEITNDKLECMVMLRSLIGENALEEIPEDVFWRVLGHMLIFHRGEIEKDPYIKNIHLHDCTYGEFKLGHLKYDKYELFHCDTPETVAGITIPRIGVFDYEFEYPYISENENVWMSITPNEIFTMYNAINESYGKVLTLGLGMGYFAYMASLRDNVESVTIVEKNQNIIDLFNNEILPQFEHKKKINIIKIDAFDFIKNLPDGKYDYCFADIWKSPEDVKTYLKLKHLCSRFKIMDINYWIEESLIDYIFPCVMVVMNECLYKQCNIEIPDINLPSSDQKTIDLIRKKLKNYEIKDAKDVYRLLDWRFIAEII